ncbi:MAG: hypothetical protein M3458_04640 [Acidobacteriota bacterium]|nr:hypothetical protein [Acidobacteriota bacterium]
MRLLTWLTVIYAVVLVLALAVSLITIFFYLWRIGSALAEVKRGLIQARENTAPLQGHLEFINCGLSGVSDGLQSVDGHLAGVDDSLNAVAEHLGIGEPV